MSRILLVNPPFYSFMGLEQNYVPLSLLAVGSEMARNGHDVFIKNLEMSEETKYLGYKDRFLTHDNYLKLVNDFSHPIWKTLVKTIEETEPDTIGFTILNVKYRSARNAIQIARNYCSNIMVGGFHPTQFPSLYKDEIICKGEYESLGGTRLIDLDKLALSNYDILLDRYSPEGYGHVMSARGCPFKCRFCASQTMWQRKVTYKSIPRILSEMYYVQNRFNPPHFTFWDETFTLNKKRVFEFCSSYNGKTPWRCDTRADHVTDEIIEAMVNANCTQMSLGIESGSDEILEYIGKNETRETFRKAADILNAKNVHWKAYCIIGFPKETEEDIFETLNFIKSLGPARITLSYFTPYQGTELYEECVAEGLINQQGYESALYAHQSPYNYFTKNISRERYNEIKRIISDDIDKYNEEELKEWK